MVRKNKAVFLDRDGVLTIPKIKNGKSYAPTKVKDFKIYKNTNKQIAKLKKLGFKTLVVTNQPDVNRGIISKKILNKMHTYLKKKIKINKVFTCPHKPEELCKCRKPSPNMILKAAVLYNINLKKSFMIGDRKIDILSGKKAGCKTIFIDKNYKEKKPTTQNFTAANLKLAVKYIELL